MNAEGTLPWQKLLPAPQPGTPAVNFRGWLLTKHGEPLLWIPAEAALARQTLRLYPAQTRRARWARRLVSWAVGLPGAPGLRRLTLSVAADAAFLPLLAGSGQSPDQVRFGIFCGNPRAEGRRIVFLRFGSDNLPDAIIKAGDHPAAHARLEAETALLRAHPVERLRAPPLKGVWQNGPLRAMVQSYAPGDCPRHPAETLVATLLAGWLDPSRQMPVAALPLWRLLEARLPQDVRFPNSRSRLAEVQVAPALVHGDFAPWNLRVERGTGRCWVLDWERGREGGLAGWDWAYWVVQVGLLVRRWSPERMMKELEAWLERPAVRGYLTRAGVHGIARTVVLSGLWYHYLFWPPTERADAWASLLRALQQRWSARPGPADAPPGPG
ncbi:phosphotransferase [Limisphaera sp. VF-2]|jgi:hypothetical protein|uniref:phosphotransferase n=1 Tax=Limisphaera sp. VF-2 TaxID=3400418 RepID=UPI001776BB36